MANKSKTKTSKQRTAVKPLPGKTKTLTAGEAKKITGGLENTMISGYILKKPVSTK